MEQVEAQDTGPSGKLAAATGFLVATRSELYKVSWPSREELKNATRSVVAGAALLGVAIGLVDWLLQKILVDFVTYLAR